VMRIEIVRQGGTAESMAPTSSSKMSAA